MKYNFFCQLQARNIVIPSQVPVPVELADIYSEYFGRLEDDNDFIGIVDRNGTTLQMMYHAADDTFWTEIPRPGMGGSYGAYLTFDDAVDLLKALPEEFQPADFPSLKFQEW